MSERIATPKQGDRTSCWCNQEIIYTGGFWRHVGIDKPQHIARPKQADGIHITMDTHPDVAVAEMYRELGSKWMKLFFDAALTRRRGHEKHTA